jgi:hypothetical protein
MTEQKEVHNKSLDQNWPPAACPHCGAALNSRKDIRDHLTLHVCRNGGSQIGIDTDRRRDLENDT